MLDFDPNSLRINFDHVNMTKTLDRVMGQIIREAAREWLRAILVSIPARGGFPVLTGAAKSTLVPLGRFLKQVSGLQVVPTFDKKHPYKDRRSEGEASQEFDITDVPRGGRTNYDGEYHFSWSNDILHYYLNEYYGLIPFAPWHTLEAGERAFEAHIQEALDRKLPGWEEFLSWGKQ